MTEEKPQPLRGIPYVTDPGAAVPFQYSKNQVVIPATGEISVMSTFWFRNLEIDERQWPQLGWRELPESWFFCVVRYSDTYGVDGETGYYAKLLFDDRALAPTERNRRYIYWH